MDERWGRERKRERRFPKSPFDCLFFYHAGRIDVGTEMKEANLENSVT